MKWRFFKQKSEFFFHFIQKVVQARNDRDAATTRRTKAEVELAKTRVELMQANSELLEAIQQKVELSEQLEQWQVIEMHKIIISSEL